MKARTQTTVSASSQRRPAETGPNESFLSMKHHIYIRVNSSI